MNRRYLLVVLAGACLVPSATHAQPQLDPAVLKKLKAGTVLLEVLLPDGKNVSGSGFFTDEPGVIVTNAHVLGMRDADARPPVKISVTVNSGETNSKTVAAKFLGGDRGTDLAVLRIEGKDLPEPLSLASAASLNETDPVFIFGFPLGTALGKNITVSASSVSSLRKVNGVLKEIQVNGGMHRGNSGGPVVNGKGEVVGVSVAAIAGTQINFAIPGDAVTVLLNGKLTNLGMQLPYKSGDELHMPVSLYAVDPLGRIKNMTVEAWTGDPAGRSRPGGLVEPAPVAGDSSPILVAKADYKKEVQTSVDLLLPKLEAKKVYWIRPTWVDGQGKTHWFAAVTPRLGAAVERKDVQLSYKPKAGKQPAQLVSQGEFRVRVGSEPESQLALNLKAGLAEETRKPDGDRIPIRMTYTSFSLGLVVDKKPITGDADLKRIANAVRFLAADLEMDSDGNLTQSKPDLSKVPKPSREDLTDISDQVLQSLELLSVRLPTGTIKAKQSWKASRNLMIGNAVVGVPAQADIKYTYLGVRKLGEREIAFLDLDGKVRGRRGDGLNVGGTVNGGAQVALDTGEVLSATVTVKADMDGVFEKRPAKLFGTLIVQIRRGDQAEPKPAEPKQP